MAQQKTDNHYLRADLHTHSTASDGQYTPAEVVALAKRAGIQVLALTDHDTVDGLPEALRAGEALGVRVLRGIELSAREYPTFHILGYGFDPDAPALAELCRRMRRSREERKGRILRFLAEKGMPLSLEEVEEFGPAASRPHFAQAMVRRGYASSVEEAFSRCLGTEEFMQKAERPKPAARECVECLKAAGGKVSLAHPYQIGLPDTELERLTAKLCAYGLDAIECYYPRHTPEQTAFYLRLAERFHLRVTGGSDFHGERVKADIVLTPLELEVEWLFTA